MMKKTMVLRIRYRLWRLITGLLIGLMIVTVPSMAQIDGRPSTAILYNSDESTITIARYREGNFQHAEIYLPQVDDGYQLAEKAIVSPHDNLILYRMDAPTGDAHEYLIYDYGQNRVHVQYRVDDLPFTGNVPDSLSHHELTNIAFDGDYVALGVGRFHMEWDIFIFDINTGEIAYRLDESAPVLTFQLSHPTILDFRYPEVTFVLFNPGESADRPTDTYVWNVLEGTVSMSDVRYSRGFDRWQGELIVPDGEEQRALYLYAEGQAPMIVYEVTEDVILRVRFIQNGERLLVAIGQTGWQIIERDGTLVGTFDVPLLDMNGVMGTPDGFLYTHRYDGGLHYVHTRDAANVDSPLTSELLLDGKTILLKVNYEIIPTQYTPWRVSEVAVMPTRSRIGEQAIITEAGNQVRIRNEPTISSEIIQQINTGTVITIIGGSIEADGYTWWQIRVDDTIGWMVQDIGGDTFIEALP